MLITFLDYDKTYQADSTGFNKIGIVLENGNVLHPLKNRVVETSLDIILKYPHAQFALKEDVNMANVHTFFSDNWKDIDILKPISASEHSQRWCQLVEQAQQGDLLCTFDTKSIASRIISYVDNGPWSHTAFYSGNGTIFEAITSGIVERPIEVYSSFRYRVGLYRLLNELPNPTDSIAFAKEQIGEKYSYRKAIRAGLQKLLHHRRTAPTPNDLPIILDVWLVCLI